MGSNIGLQLDLLQKMGFKHLYGIEISEEAIEISKKLTRNIFITKGSAFDIPYEDNYFDLVFTSGVLIHIEPQDIKDVLKEIYRVSKKYIWGFEYYAEEYTDIDYRGEKNLLWKTDFVKIYKQSFPDLKILKREQFQYKENPNLLDEMYLLSKL